MGTARKATIPVVNLAATATAISSTPYGSTILYPAPPYPVRYSDIDEQEGYPATNLIGAAEDLWKAKYYRGEVDVAPPNAIALDLGSAKEVSAVAVTGSNFTQTYVPGGAISKILIQYSTNDLSWPSYSIYKRPIPTYGYWTTWAFANIVDLEYTPGGVIRFSFTAKTARYWRVHFQEWYSSWEAPEAQRVHFEADQLFLGASADVDSWPDGSADDTRDVVPDDPDSWTELVDNPAKKVQVLVAVDVAERLDRWDAAGDDSWEHDVDQKDPGDEPAWRGTRIIDDVVQDGTDSLTSVASSADVDTTPGSWYYLPPDVPGDPGKLYVHPRDGLPPDEHIIMASFKMYYCTGGLSGSATVFNAHQYYPYIAPNGIPKITMALQDPLFGGVSSSVGDLVLMNNDGHFDKISARYRWESRGVDVRVGGGNLPLSQYRTFPESITHSQGWNENRFRLAMRSTVDYLNTSIPASASLDAADLTTYYEFRHELVASYHPTAGTVRLTRHLKDRAPYLLRATDIDANAANVAPIGKTKPLLYGTCYGVEGIVLAQSTTERMVMLAGHQIRQVLDAVNADGGRASRAYHPHDASPDVTWSDGIYHGEVRIDLEHGIVHEVYNDTAHDTQSAPYVTAPWFLNSSDGPFLYDVEGLPNADGTLCQNPADVVQAVIERCTNLSINATAFAAAGVEADLYDVSLQILEPDPAIEALSNLLRAIGGHLYVDRSSLVALTIQIPDITPVMTLTDATGDIYNIESVTDYKIVATSIVVSYPGPVAGGSNLVAVSVPSPEARGMKTVDAQAAYPVPLANEDSAILSATNQLRRRMKPMNVLTIASNLKIASLDLTDVVKVQRTRLPVDVLGYYIGRVQELSLDFNSNTHEVVLDDSKTMLNQQYQAFISGDETLLHVTAATDVQQLTMGFWTDDDGYVVTGDPHTYRRSMYF